MYVAQCMTCSLRPSYPLINARRLVVCGCILVRSLSLVGVPMPPSSSR